ncbi:hypothetical protein [Caloramator sp. Dgby_cultured_2]|uniref:hypothetical protein n=1 Tax=Caloramator sp. Dgby_cultured_2 TaxID=3029174 RepID=UPI00237E5DF2|nr:hypothetical protein [Caloramator sp. Dgby_cultured_2]WDU84222.1 hypothetical protein PWK10_07850 [Caloramator sp. Dgby_cultured_2]
MSPEVVKLAYRCIINYMGGDIGKFNELVAKAMEIYKSEGNICECGSKLINATYRHGKEKCSVKLCTNCGQVFKDGEKLMKIRRVKVC